MQNKYQLKIENMVLPKLYSFDQLINEGILDDVDENIKIRLVGDKAWITARSYPFAEIEKVQRHSYLDDQIPFTQIENMSTKSDLRRDKNPYQSSQQFFSHNTGGDVQLREPPIIGKWNWGAFCLSWLWGIFNGLYWPLIVIALNFIPYIGIVVSFCICFILGIKGNKLAWDIAQRNGVSAENFVNKQVMWNTAGVVMTILIAFVILVFFLII